MLMGLDAQAPHSSLVAAVLRQRLSPEGQAVICCAVRDQASLRTHSRRCLLCLSTILYFVCWLTQQLLTVCQPFL